MWLLADGAAGQTASPTGNLYGTALDPQGKPVAGATVTVTGPGAAHTSNTDARGDFHFLNLSPGDYSVTLERSGFATARRNVTVGLGNVVLSIPLQVAGVEESLAVEGVASSFDSREVQTGATFGQKDSTAFRRRVTRGGPATVSGRFCSSTSASEAATRRTGFLSSAGLTRGPRTASISTAPRSAWGRSPPCSSISIRWTRSRSQPEAPTSSSRRRRRPQPL